MTITYALIAESEFKSTSQEELTTQLICETSRQQTLRRVIEQKIIPKMMSNVITSTSNKLILTHEMFTFFIQKECSAMKNVFYVVISTHDNHTKHSICWKMIDSMIEQYQNNRTTINLSTLMKFHNDSQNDKISKLQTAIEDVKNVMIINIDKILDNHKKMHDLIVETDSLKEQGELFAKGGNKLKWAMMKRWFIITGAAVTTITITIGTVALILALAL